MPRRQQSLPMAGGPQHHQLQPGAPMMLMAGGNALPAHHSPNAHPAIGQLPAAVPPYYAIEAGVKMPRSRGRCLSAICVSWKVFTCVFSHVLLVTLVVAYCLLGAKTFEYLEADNEIEVKKSISYIRGNLTRGIWLMTYRAPVLYEANWTTDVIAKLQTFETDLLQSMKKGWDGNEDTSKRQWTFSGALFYSIIVITTIGYGHIAPKTSMGKISTIFYAILGIPLMLLCLSTIGDIMASSFRFIYWRVCCFVCTREPRRSRRSHRPATNRNGGPPFTSQPMPAGGGAPGYDPYRGALAPPMPLVRGKSNPNTMRRSIRVSQRTTDSGFAQSVHDSSQLPHAHSDTELRYSDARASGKMGSSSHRNQYYQQPNPGQQQRFSRSVQREQPHRDRHTVERDRIATRPAAGHHLQQQRIDEMQPQTPMNRRRSMNPRRFGRSQSMAPDTMTAPQSPGGRADFDAQRNTMTLPASYGRGRHRNANGARPNVRAQSLDPRDRGSHFSAASLLQADAADLDAKSPAVLCNKYVIDDACMPPAVDRRRSGGAGRAAAQQRPANGLQARCQSMPRQSSGRHATLDRSTRHDGQHPAEMPATMRGADVYDNYHTMPASNRKAAPANGHRLRPPAPSHAMYDDDDEDDDVEAGTNGIGRFGDDGQAQARRKAQNRQRRHQQRAQPLPPSPRIMTPLGFAIHRQARLAASAYNDDDSMYEYDYDAADEPTGGGSPVRPVPIWLCVFLVVSYIIAGAFLFSQWEGWSFLDSAYFCFITLTTIGFGDFVPAQGVKGENEEMSIAFCSLYLLFGIALLAMSFNLVQEEVIANVKNVARQLGILKEDDY